MVKNTLYIEHCVNCAEHGWCTNHKEEKYLSWCVKVKNAVNENFQDINIVVNTKTAEYLTKDKNKITSPCLAFPRLGSFEVYLNNSLVFSKLSSKIWPNIQNLLGKIMYMLDSNLNHSRTLKINSEALSLISERRNSNLSNKIIETKNLKNSSKGFSKADKDRFTEKFTKSIKKKLPVSSSYKKMTPRISSNKIHSYIFNQDAFKLQSTKSSSRESLLSHKPQKKCVFISSSLSKLSKSERISNNLNIKSYKISIPLNKAISKKIPISNSSSNPQTLTVSSSDKNFIHIKTPEITVHSNSTEHIKFICLSKDIPTSRKVYVSLKLGEQYFSAYELELEYINNE